MVTTQISKANKPVNPYAKQAIHADTLKKDGIDPICKMKVKAGTTKTVVFDKVTYGFCSESCKKTFSQSPTKYLKK
ncbi:MAG: YHS domain-containing protein, partial [Pedobacter sp.]